VDAQDGTGAGRRGAGKGGGAGPGSGTARLWSPQLARAAFLQSPAAMHLATGVGQNERTRVISAFRNTHGQPCHLVEQTVYIDGERARATGTVCRQSNGKWALTP
jgi:hypothetical protein